MAARLLKEQFVQQEIERLRGNSVRRVIAQQELNIQTTLTQLRHLLTIDPLLLFAPDGSLLPIEKMDPSIRAAIASLEVEEKVDKHQDSADIVRATRITKVKFWSKPQALAEAMQHFDLRAAAGLTQQTRDADQLKRAEEAKAKLRELLEEGSQYWHRRAQQSEAVAPLQPPAPTIKPNGAGNGQGGNGVA